MPFEVNDFVEAPTVQVLDNLKKAELLAVIRELQIDYAKASMNKSELKSIIAEYFVEVELFEEDVLEEHYCKPETVDPFELKKLEMEMKLK